MNRIKSAMMLLVILNIASLNAMEDKKKNCVSLCLLERQRLTKEISLEKDAMVRHKKLKKERREQTILSYDDLEYVTVLQPVGVEKFRKIIG
jgi:hypothetical protein